MCETEVKPAVPKITYGTAARTSFQDTQSYVAFLFSKWRILVFTFSKTLECAVNKRSVVVAKINASEKIQRFFFTFLCFGPKETMYISHQSQTKIGNLYHFFKN